MCVRLEMIAADDAQVKVNAACSTDKLQERTYESIGYSLFSGKFMFQSKVYDCKDLQRMVKVQGLGVQPFEWRIFFERR